MTAAQKAVAQDSPSAVAAELAIIASTLATLHGILQRMPERCDPYVYYRRVRPYLHGWADHPSLPDGVAYEGVAAYGGAPQKFRGETGAQSSIIPSLDAALKIVHADDPLRRYLREMLDYMPPQHRAFIRAIESGPCVRDYVVRCGSAHPELRDAYNAAIEGVEAVPFDASGVRAAVHHQPDASGTEEPHRCWDGRHAVRPLPEEASRRDHAAPPGIARRVRCSTNCSNA